MFKGRRPPRTGLAKLTFNSTLEADGVHDFERRRVKHPYARLTFVAILTDNQVRANARPFRRLPR